MGLGWPSRTGASLGQRGFWLPPPPPTKRAPRPGICVSGPSTEGVVWGLGLTLRYSTGLVTLNLSIVVMMMAGVVRKKRRMKRTTLMTRQRSHQMKPRMERCSLEGRGEGHSRDTPALPPPFSAAATRPHEACPSHPTVLTSRCSGGQGRRTQSSWRCAGTHCRTRPAAPHGRCSPGTYTR